MPSWKLHLIFDLIFLVVAVGVMYSNGFIWNLPQIAILVLLNLLAALLPDIDTPKSNIRKYASFLLAIIAILYLVVEFSMDSFASVLVGFLVIYLVIRFFPTEHRGATHKLWFSLVFAFALTTVFWFVFDFSLFEFGIYYLIIFWGFLSHLILDKIS